MSTLHEPSISRRSTIVRATLLLAVAVAAGGISLGFDSRPTVGLQTGEAAMADSTEPRVVAAHPSRTDGWLLRTIDGTVYQQHVRARCRTRLVEAGAKVEVVDYRTEIAGSAPTPIWLTCDALAELFRDRPPPTPPTSSSRPTTSSTPTTTPGITVVPTTQPATTSTPSTQQSTVTTSTTGSSAPPSSTSPPTTQPPTTEPATTQPVTTQPPTTQPATTQSPGTRPPSGVCVTPGGIFAGSVPSGGALDGDKPRIFITTDVRPFGHPGEYDDKLSLITLMLFLDVLDLEGIAGDPAPINQILETYRQDLPKLRTYSSDYPDPGQIVVANPRGSSDGAQALVDAATKADTRPLYVLTWGGYHVLANAFQLADQQGVDLTARIRVLSIGEGNVRKGSVPSAPFGQVYEDRIKRDGLWAVLDQVGFNGITHYTRHRPPPGRWAPGDDFVSTYVGGHGHLGDLYAGVRLTTRMGDFPTVLYLLRGDPNRPDSEHWGGRFAPLAEGHQFGDTGRDGGLPQFWTAPTNGSDTYRNPWGRTVTGSRVPVEQYAMQWLPEFAARYDRAEYRNGTNPNPIDVFRYTDRCQ